MPRQEFSRKVKMQRAEYAQGLCEYCGLRPKGTPEYDHYKEAGDGGDNSFENCRHVCAPCHRQKTNHYVKERRKAERVRDKNNGSLKSKQGFRRAEPQRNATRTLEKHLPPKTSIFVRTK